MIYEMDIEQISEPDLKALVDNSVIENKKIEYKQLLPGSSDSDKKEFLADVSSFANAAGGIIIYGMVEDAGTPKQLEGLTIGDTDQEILRLESMIRDGIEPRIPSIASKPIALSNAKTALIIKIPKSWISPHRVKYQGHDKFYSRSSNGKYSLDVSELRLAFNMSETITERIVNFRRDRISKILSNETPVPVYDNPKVVLHSISINSFGLSHGYDISRVASNPTLMSPINGSVSHHRYNLDGFLTYSDGENNKFRSYAQLFRNGIIEAVEAWMLRRRMEPPLIPNRTFEEQLIKSLADYLSLFRLLNIELPIFIFLTLLGVKGYRMGINTERFWIDELYPIDRDALMLPEIVIENYNDRADKVLKPCFDAVWNSCGFTGSFNYNDAGEWAPR
jgi:hypothetical protein